MQQDESEPSWSLKFDEGLPLALRTEVPILFPEWPPELCASE